jgi:hypothetical protein
MFILIHKIFSIIYYFSINSYLFKLKFIYFWLGVYIIGIRARFLMGTNKERIEHLESRLGAILEGLQWMEFGINDKLYHLEEALNRLSNVLLSNPKSSNHGNHH